MAGGSVRQHTRKTKNGTVKVGQHSRRGRGGKGKKKTSLAGRGWKNTKQAWKYGRKKKKAMCFTFAVLAVAQLGAYVGLQGLMFTAATVALVAAAVATLAFAAASGGRML
jgi:hypothetical protein